METKYTTCVFCDGGCRLRADVGDDGAVRFSPASSELPAICSKVRMLDEYRNHPDRITHPLKNVGARGEAVWQEVSWDEALDDIARRMRAIVEEHGPEALAFAEMPLNHGFGGITRRLMNLIGTPNYTAPVQLCMGNTAQVHRTAYGWLALANWAAADCIVYFGQDRDMERWPAEYLKLKAALERGATLICVDPRETATAKLAQHHLRIRYGTDAALALGWINVIIAEELYDRAFVEEQCTGFDELCERAAAWPPERVAGVCGIDADVIRETARLYAGAEAAIIPWGVVGDMQVNSTSLLRAQCILRAICGFLNVSELVPGPSLGFRTNAQVADFALLPREKRDLQLGTSTHPLLTFRTSALYREANEREGAPFEPDILAESCACDPSTLFAAMRGEGPYPVKGIFSIANNTVMSYAGQQGIVDAFMNQDLVVAFEHWMTPTAQLADYVLPGDMWAERDTLGGAFDVGPAAMVNQALLLRRDECKSWFFVAKGLADRLGFAEFFPWENEHAYLDWRLAPLETTWDEAAATPCAPVGNRLLAPGRFVTPSGKVELCSSVLAALGFDPLPSFEEPADPGAREQPGAFPYLAFAGYRERYTYNTNLHQIAPLRKREPEPLLFINPADAAAEELAEGAPCRVESAYGGVVLRAHVDEAQPAGTVRIPHGWWKPETAQGLDAGLSGAALHNDGMLFPDADWNLDPAQGVPGLRGSIHVRICREANRGV